MTRREQRRDIVIDLFITIGLLLLREMAVRTHVQYPPFTARTELLLIVWERYNQATRTLAAERDVALFEWAEGIPGRECWRFWA